MPTGGDQKLRWCGLRDRRLYPEDKKFLLEIEPKVTHYSLLGRFSTDQNAPMNDVLERVVMWRNLQIDGIDRCELRRTAEGYSFTGTVLGVLTDKRHPVETRYEIHCDDHWRTHRVQIDQVLGEESRSLSLSVEILERWRENGKEIPGLNECIDVDLGITPATNTLPIRRVGLEVGQRQHLTAAWVKFPELAVQPLKQTYVRLSNSTYRYEGASGFSADIVVDDLGLVVTYPGGWERLGSA